MKREYRIVRLSDDPARDVADAPVLTPDVMRRVRDLLPPAIAPSPAQTSRLAQPQAA